MSTQLAPVAADTTSAATPRPQLTDRQRYLLGLVADGHTHAAIAQHIGISQDSVQRWLSAIYRRLAARNAIHAVAIAYPTGLLPAPQRTPGGRR